MSLLLLFKAHDDVPAPPGGATPYRTLVGVGITLALLFVPLTIF